MGSRKHKPASRLCRECRRKTKHESGTCLSHRPASMATLDEASYRAGIEAAALLLEGHPYCLLVPPSTQAWAHAIRALPTPSTLPQEES